MIMVVNIYDTIYSTVHLRAHIPLSSRAHPLRHGSLVPRLSPPRWGEQSPLRAAYPRHRPRTSSSFPRLSAPRRPPPPPPSALAPAAAATLR